NGPSNATGVNITDKLDSAFEFIAELNPDAVYENGVVTWNINRINVNETASVVLIVRVVKEGNFSNVAFAMSSENDTVVNGSSENVTAGTVILNVTKVANVTQVHVGDVVRFNITVNNTGSANATGVNVTDVLDPAFEFVNASDNAKAVDNVVVWNVGDIVNGTSVTVWVEVRVKTNGTFTNVATVIAKENKTSFENETNITVNPIVDLSIIKYVSATNITIGDEIVYTIVVVNNGPSNATNVNVTENLKGNVEFINVNASKGDYDKSTGIWAVGTLKYNESVTLILTVKVLSGETIENAVSVNSTENDTKPGNNNYTSENVTVNKAPSFVDAEDVNLTYGEVIVIPVHSENATGIIYQIINPEGDVVSNGTIGVGENITGLDLSAGDYVINLTTIVDVNHTVATNTSKLTVNKAVPPMDITPMNITYGENETIIIELPENATGTVNITVGNKTFEDIPIENGTVNINIPDLPAGNYTVNVTYSGNENYTSINGSESFNVKKIDTPINLDTQDIFYGEEEIIVVTLPEDATGTVNVTVGDKTYENLPINNGKVELPIDNLGGGTYHVEVVYGGDSNHNGNTTSGSFVVSPVKPIITIEVEDIWVGEVEILNVTVNAPGSVNITVNGITVTVSLENGVITTDVLAAGILEDYNGRATWNIINLPVGLYPAFAIYGGNENYTSVNISDVFRVKALPSSIDITTHDIYVGEDESIQVVVNYTDATGNITITVDGKNYSSPVVNGTAKFIVPGLKAGEYDVVATYSGDDKYLPSNATGEFKVSKLTPAINVDAPDIKVGEDGVITVSVPEDATGMITIVIGGKEYTAPIKDGKAIFVIPGLSEGTYEIIAYYSGDDKYNSIDGVGSINVLHLEENKTIEVVENPSIDVGLVSYPTGNPILMVLLAVMLIGFASIKRFKK
ncbi:MAG: Ig-like domain repeat protein, partial [Methanobrevibacter sp.]|uniref:Ig-like domain repeat protein n=1 Tax=Methanobrevibacter sp. TaxID=66852 RepID=UPI001B0D5E5C